MRKLVALTAATIGALGLLATPATADDTCGALVADLGGLAYIVQGTTDEDGGTWIYLESNGVAGVQRGGSASYGDDLGGAGLLMGRDFCQNANHDTAIF